VKTHWSTLIPFRNTTLIKIRGTHKNLATCAHALFDCYHYFDKEGVDLLYVEKLPEKGIGYSIMNRVKRSAEGSIASG
jgi:L-threonylcarbamoyladenylate synthase